MERRSARRVLIQVAETLAIAALYYGTGQLGLFIALPPGLATSVWPPSGIALAAVLCRGNHAGLGIWLGSFLVNSHALAGSSLSPFVMLVVASTIGLGSTAQALLGAFLIDHVVGTRRLFTRARDVFRFVGVEALSCLLAATFGATSMCLSALAPWSAYGANWVTWYLGDLVGIVVVAPLPLTWQLWVPRGRDPRRLAEAVLLLGLLLIATYMSFGHVWHIPFAPYTLFPLIVWASFRFGQPGAVIATLCISAIAIVGTLNDFGPFARASRHEALWLLQAFLGIVAVTGLVLAAALKERTQVEHALRESEERFRQLAENIHEVFWLSDLRQPEMFYISPAYEKVWGRTRQSLYENPLAFVEAIHPEDRQRVITALAQQQRGLYTSTEYRVVQPDGTIRLIWDRGFPIKNQAGEVYRVTGIAEDITERKHTEEALQRAHESLALAQHASASGLWDWDRNTNVTYASVEFRALYGFGSEVVLNYETWIAAVHSDDRQRLRQSMRQAFKRQEDWNEEFRIMHPRGGERWLAAIGKIMRDAQGRPVRMMGINIDITARKSAELALQRAYAGLEQRIQERTAALAAANATLSREIAERQQVEAERRRLEREAQRAEHFALLGRLAAGVAHEIRNPLAVIVLQVDLLEEELQLLPPVQQAQLAPALTDIKTHLGRLGDLVQDYLSLVRIAAVDREAADLGALVAALATELNGELAAHGITLYCEGLNQLGEVNLHHSTFQRALLNLLHNAMEAMPQGGTLILRGRRDATQVHLEVSDTGAGIPAEHLPQIFEPLFTTKPAGTGLGLYLVQEIVTAHQGQIVVHSVVEHGTRFTITLPCATAVVLSSPDREPPCGPAL